MANGRKGGRKGDTGRDGGGFAALPWTVLDCPAYVRLSHPARALLLEVARQFVHDNNGRLLTSMSYLSKRGWNSADVITRAKRELLEGGFIHETVKGHRPNKASWYAVTWRLLDRLPGYDPGAAAAFERSAYRKREPVKNAVLRPSHGAKGSLIAPPHGTGSLSPRPPDGAVWPVLERGSAPFHGNHLESHLQESVQRTPDPNGTEPNEVMT